jgi:hypothetical protein
MAIDFGCRIWKLTRERTAWLLSRIPVHGCLLPRKVTALPDEPAHSADTAAPSGQTADSSRPGLAAGR